MSSTELGEEDSVEKNEYTTTLDGLPAYQQSIHNFLKRQLSNTTTTPQQQSLLEADKDIIEIDLDEERNNESIFDTNNSLNNNDNESYQSPVYPALFLNHSTTTHNDNIFILDDENSYYHETTSVYEKESEEEDYFTLSKTNQSGMILSGILHKKYKMII